MNKKSHTEIYRIQEFLKTYRNLTEDHFWHDLLMTTGIYKYYQDKLRQLMVIEGKYPHPHPKERLENAL